MKNAECLNPKVSVILPVWNPGPGISRCIESLRNQTLKEIEMIFVDDCGTDDSMEIVWAAAAVDARIRVIENDENIGAGPSRNKGIEAAAGEYLSFIDSDDYVKVDFLELLYHEAIKQSFDIVKGSRFIQTRDNVIISPRANLNSMLKSGLKEGKPLYLLFTHEHQSAIYKRELLLAHNAFYGSSARAQDITFLLKVCSQATSFSLIDQAHYYLCERSGSAMHTLDEKKIQGILLSVHEQVDYVLEHLLHDKWIQERMKNRFFYAIKDIRRQFDVPDSTPYLKNAAQKLHSEWIRLPFHQNLEKIFFPLRALQVYEVLLPTEPIYLPGKCDKLSIRYSQLVGVWVDFYLANPEERRFCQKDLIGIIICAKIAIKGKPIADDSPEEIEQGRFFLNYWIKKLPLKIQAQIAILYPVAITRKTIGSMLPKRIKRRLQKLL